MVKIKKSKFMLMKSENRPVSKLEFIDDVIGEGKHNAGNLLNINVYLIVIYDFYLITTMLLINAI
jgi:hypothetical protein